MGRAPRGRGGALGDAVSAIAAVSNPVSMLAAQVNRFGSDAPAAYQFATTPFLDTGNLSPGLALVALTIYQRRAADAYSQFHDQGSLALLAAANQGFSAPVPFVMTHLSDVTQAVQGFADSVGLPPAVGTAAPAFDTSTLAILVAAGVTLWWFTR